MKKILNSRTINEGERRETENDRPSFMGEYSCELPTLAFGLYIKEIPLKTAS